MISTQNSNGVSMNQKLSAGGSTGASPLKSLQYGVL